MRIVRRPDQLARIIQRAKRSGRRIGFVPTMGAFHEGHLSLIRRARRETDLVVVSIFVNPIQFNRRADFRSYPRTLTADARLAAGAGADLLFAPSAGEIYPPGFQTFVEVTSLSRPLEGRFR
ncbi:MAG: pantoate--beta-alanine ligase, partial [Candidatus Omnitrophica bacterium]|nr:pantoate--beta-alanine ligase [Candidatus Omnitrophota bacterium]